ncbi:hypothetical protein CKO42_25710 [Lamprobacter modestohalophilus]|jgi:hypothetical protein|uniref:Uncharacterized protein n=1 Tax=Lamprobacter modestohalophilus TaxID=1064514 RepID=A0A9X1B7B6_9GAMM|nr:hypothetical protein [Lamprobacter modestohalophilus]
MPKSIEVEIDAAGRLRPLTPLPRLPLRGLLVLSDDDTSTPSAGASTAANALKLLASPRYDKRPLSQPEEVSRRIAALRSDWDSKD